MTVANLFSSLILGILFAILTHPLYRNVLRKVKQKETIAALITLILISIIIILPFLGITTLLTAEALALFNSLKDKFILDSELLNFLQPIAEKLNINLVEIVNGQLVPVIKNLGLVISRELGTALSNAFNLGLNLFIFAMTFFYMLKDGKKFGEYLIKLSPLETERELALYETFKNTGKAIFYGTFISAIIQGILGGIGFALFGISSPVLWGAIMALLALIPVLGPFVIFLPASIYLFAIGNTVSAIIFLAYNILIVSSVDNLIKPKVMSGKVNIHPLLMLFAILGGLSSFGIIGIIYGPIIITVFLALIKVYLEEPKLNEENS